MNFSFLIYDKFLSSTRTAVNAVTLFITGV
jgi:hypothetical protein